MATAKDFVVRVDQVEGVDGCLLVKKDGRLLGQTLDDYKTYAALMATAAEQAYSLMDKIGFSYCRHLCFNCCDNRHFLFIPDRQLFAWGCSGK